MIILPQQKDRILVFNKQVNQDSIGDLSKQILEINEDDRYIGKIYKVHGMEYEPKPIKVNIDSYGGTVYQCLGLLGIIKNSKTPVHTIVTGCAMSCGFLISIAGHKRFSYQGATFLYHQVSGAKSGKLKDMEEGIMEAQRLQKIIESHTTECTKITKTKLKEIYDKKKDWYMDADEALKFGVIDKVL